MIKGSAYDPLANYADAVNMKNPKKKNKFEDDEEGDGDGDDESAAEDFDFDEFTEENHLASLADFANYAKDHKGNQMKNMQIIV